MPQEDHASPDLHAEFASWLQSTDARAAFDYLLQHASTLPDYRCYLHMQGYLRTFRYSIDGERPFGFIVNRNDLLFYFRSAAQSHPAADVEMLSQRFRDVRRLNNHEICLRISTEQDAKSLVALIFGQASADGLEMFELEEQHNKFTSRVADALRDDPVVRAVRLSQARRLPEKVLVQTHVYARNPDVVAEVLLRANGICEMCTEPAPFRRKSDGTPYLEVHHKIQLADNGEDTVQNAIAACPNCHRRAHYGEA